MNTIRRVAGVGNGALWLLAGFVFLLLGFSSETGAQSTGQVGVVENPRVEAGFLSALEWRLVGPFRGGRVPAVAGDPNNPLVFYFGSGHGGVWKTTDAGRFWRNVSDGFFTFPAVGAMDHTPRRLLAMIVAGMKDDVLASNGRIHEQLHSVVAANRPAHLDPL